MELKLIFIALNFLICALIVVTAFVLVIKYANLTIKYNKLYKYIQNYLNVIITARYGNLNNKCVDGVDALTLQLSKYTNALIESIKDRDTMINEYIEKEKESQNLKQDFISGLTHDLKVPIIAQDNTCDLFLEGKFGIISDVQKDAIKNLKISNNDLKNLIINLLDVQKLDTKELVLNYEIINLNETIKEVLEQNKSILTIQNKEIFFNSNCENVLYKADKFLLKRALNNLISNAIFYGKNSKNIYISLYKNNDFIEITVSDEGDGIKEDNINDIFKKYYTSAKKYSNVGIGLGLYIVNKIILAHNGTIKAKNNKPKGASFIINLPIK